MIKIIASLLILTAAAPLAAYPTHPRGLTQHVKSLYDLEETRQLLAQVEKEGAISIQSARFGYSASNAAWMADARIIYLNFSKPRSPGSLIASLVFELHNALSSQEFAYYDHLAMSGQLSKEEYIQAIEHIEYINAQKTSYILYQGVRQGIFPRDAEWGVAPTFNEHFRIQIQAGHSAQIGLLYDDLIRCATSSIARK